MPDEAVYMSPVLLCLQPLPGEQTALFQRPLLKRHLVAENGFAFPKSLSYV